MLLRRAFDLKCQYFSALVFRYFLRRGSCLEANHFLELRVVVQTIEISIISCPLPVTVSRREGLFDRLERFCSFSENAVSAGGIVERTRVIRAKGDGGLQMPDGLVPVFFKRGQLGSQQDAGAHVFRHQFQLLPQDLEKPLLHVLRFLFSPEPFQGAVKWNIGIVVITVGFDGPLGQLRRFLISAQAKYARPRMFQDPSQSGLRSIARLASSAVSSNFFCA